MRKSCYITNPWIEQVFDSGQAKKGGIVRRDACDVRRFASEQALKLAAANRGFHIILAGNQYIIICNNKAIQIIV
jgi:hypothetical protein